LTFSGRPRVQGYPQITKPGSVKAAAEINRASANKLKTEDKTYSLLGGFSFIRGQCIVINLIPQ
jgi:hypothetical protein